MPTAPCSSALTISECGKVLRWRRDRCDGTVVRLNCLNYALMRADEEAYLPARGGARCGDPPRPGAKFRVKRHHKQLSDNRVGDEQPDHRLPALPSAVSRL